MEIRTERLEGCLCMTLTGTNSLDASLQAVAAGLASARTSDVAAVLVDVRGLEGSSSVTDRFRIGSAIGTTIGPALRIALLCRQDQWLGDRPMENSAVNRGANFLSTTSEAEALAWLRSPR